MDWFLNSSNKEKLFMSQSETAPEMKGTNQSEAAAGRL